MRDLPRLDLSGAGDPATRDPGPLDDQGLPDAGTKPGPYIAAQVMYILQSALRADIVDADARLWQVYDRLGTPAIFTLLRIMVELTLHLMGVKRGQSVTIEILDRHGRPTSPGAPPADEIEKDVGVAAAFIEAQVDNDTATMTAIFDQACQAETIDQFSSLFTGMLTLLLSALHRRVAPEELARFMASQWRPPDKSIDLDAL